jgi:hypothetical protein
MVRRKKYWYHRWREQHPLIQLYVTKEQYNMVKSIADSQNKTIKELILEAIDRLVDFEKWKREYELRIGELSKELRDKDVVISQFNDRIKELLNKLSYIYLCLRDPWKYYETVCREVCIKLKGASYTAYTGFLSLVIGIDEDCLKKLGL